MKKLRYEVKKMTIKKMIDVHDREGIAFVGSIDKCCEFLNVSKHVVYNHLQSNRTKKMINDRYSVSWSKSSNLTYPDCRIHKCTFNSEERCTILNECNFGDRKCPFMNVSGDSI